MAILGRFLIAVSLLACVACTGGTGDGTGLSDAGGSIGGDLKLTCNADQSAFPTYSRSCQDANDCAIANHMTDCCGSTIATGINKADLGSFSQAESACEPLFPACGCAAQPPLLDDGSSATNLDSIAVGCSAEGFCVTFNVELPGDGL